MKSKKGLTSKQEAYCLLRCPADGLTKSAAYRMVYDTKRMTKKSVNECACRLDANVKIISRINELRAPSVKKARVTLDGVLDHFDTAIKMATTEKLPNVIVSAAREIGKISDIYPAEKKDVTFRDDAVTAALNAGRQRARLLDG
jgi:hypothetical protein